jgi:hypothetical protein
MNRLVACGACAALFGLWLVPTEAEEADHYQRMTVRDFVTDGPELVVHTARVELAGAYVKQGNIEKLYIST